jgi:hypothetical protein
VGKKSRGKPRAQALAAQRKQARPDDYFQKGPFEMARFGKVVVMRNNMSKEQHQQLMKAMADRLPAIVAEIDAHVAAIVRLVESHDPLSLLQRGYWVSVLPHILPAGEGEKKETVVGQRMIDYVQSMVAAVLPKVVPAPEVTEAAWGELSRHVEDLFDKINHDYVRCRTASWEVNGDAFSDERQEFYVRALMKWCNVTGHRYHHQEIDYLRELLSPHSDVFQRLWGIDAEGLVNGLARILHALTRGLGESFERVSKGHKEYLQAAEQAGGDERAAVLKEKMESLGNDKEFRDAFGNLFGVGLFKIDEFLPKSLLEDLSWGVGECRDFVDGGDQSGWPTRVWPRSRRPFLSVGGSYYCFDVHTLFDHIYRVLRRAVLAREPAYRIGWNEAQKAVSEALPLKLFKKLCPGAKSWQSVFYQTREVDAFGTRRWCELDGLVAYEDHLFIVEVKAGAFTSAPPEKDFASYIKSIEKLIFDPVDQGERFFRWLNDEGKIDLFDESHNKVGELARGDFAHITVCAVSLDPFTELSAKAHHLRHLVGHQGTTPFWALSVSDLMTYAELFDNPLVFLHFVEKRGQATASSKVVLDDELDHYGMYLQHNNYDLHADQVAGDGRISWTGYRAVIDNYFDARTRGMPATLPQQDMPALYFSMVQRLAESRHANRRKAASLLLDCDGRMKENVARTLAETLREQARFRRPKLFSVAGRDVRITFCCWQNGVVNPPEFNAAGHCKASMLLAQETDRWLIELFFTAEGELWRVEPTLFVAAGLTEAERAQLALQVEFLRAQRIGTTTSRKGKLGPNELCPCGSGKKYKNCCRP